MSIVKTIRYLTILGAATVLASYAMRWEVRADFGTTHPPATLLLGLALVILSLLPFRSDVDHILPAMLVITMIIAVFVSSWLFLRTTLLVIGSSSIDLGAGPIVLIIGVALFCVGELAFLASLQDVEEKPYRVVGGKSHSSL